MTETFTTGLAHVCIETPDLEATEAFYAVLGLERRYDFRNQHDEVVGFYLAFPGSPTYVEVIHVRDPQPAGVLRHFAIEVDDIEAIHRAMIRAGIATDEPVLEKDLTRMISCHDPNGIFIEIQQYTPESMQTRGGVCRVEYEP
ncbi:VOC family protein [Elongatibacter sediminis]|uniref:VOC family protein n=1 Tax=Elongatibacter sediminis TaxID=3119006 RepID=A0AAW9RBZ0_9GAMM